ncbi:MAG: hypothetical protein QOF78_1211 [Phycisphaerales bacterium]|jgi:hypothetical protein|nr:hypothetical protein [Phycisphaerales bacterium]
MRRRKPIVKGTIAAAAAAVCVSLCASGQAAVHTSTWLGGAGGWFDNNSWSTPTFPNNSPTNQYDVFIDGGNPQSSYVTVSQGIVVDSLTLDGSLEVSAFGTFTTVNGITLNGGGIALMANAGIQVGVNGTISGNGRISSYFGSPCTVTAEGGSLTIGSGVTVGVTSVPEASSMNIGGNYPLINHGTISNLHPFATVRALGTTTTNNGTFQLGNGGKIEVGGAIDHLADLGNVTNDGTGALIFTGTYDNSASSLVLNGSTPGLEVGGTVRGGTITATASNRFVTSRNSLLLDNVSLNAPTTVKGVVRVGSGQTLTGNADILLDATAATVGTLGGTLTIASGISLHGRGTIGGAPSGLAPLVNNANITADIANSALTVFGDGITNHGTFTVTNNAILGFGGSFQVASLGTLVSSGGTLRISGNLDNTGQTLVNGSPHTWRLGSGGKITGGAVETLPGKNLMIESGAPPTLNGVQLDGTAQFAATTNTSLYIDNGITGTGTILFAASFPSGNTILNFKSNGYLPVTIGEGITIRGGSGTIRELRNHGTIHAEAGRTIQFSGNASLGGDRNAGTLKISNGGKITAENLVFDDGGQLEIDLGGSATQAALVLGGSLNLSGSDDYLNLIALSGGAPGPYLIATYSSTLTGIFDHVTPGYFVDYSTPKKIFVSVPEPSSLLLVGISFAQLLRRQRRYGVNSSNTAVAKHAGSGV